MMKKEDIFVMFIMVIIIALGTIFQCANTIKATTNVYELLGKICVDLTPLASIVAAYFLGSNSSSN